MRDNGVLDGRVAIVTGGGRGLGRALALALAEAGADVALAARSTGDIRQVAAEVEERGRRALAMPTDVTRADDVERLVERVLSELGDLDILVNNSGVVHSAPLIETTPEEWDRVVATNLRGSFLCMRAAGRHFANRRAGKVINVASNFAFMGVPNFSSYCLEGGDRQPHPGRRGRVGGARCAGQRHSPWLRRDRHERGGQE
jgi:2-deoxy-D-gluconate 3-dehydrogenase